MDIKKLENKLRGDIEEIVSRLAAPPEIKHPLDELDPRFFVSNPISDEWPDYLYAPSEGLRLPGLPGKSIQFSLIGKPGRRRIEFYVQNDGDTQKYVQFKSRVMKTWGKALENGLEAILERYSKPNPPKPKPLVPTAAI